MKPTPEDQSPPDGVSPPLTGGRPRASFRNVALLLGKVLALLIVGLVVVNEPMPVLGLAVLAVLLLTPIFVPRLAARVGRKRGWPAAAVKYGSIAFVVLWLAGLGGWLGTALHKVRATSKVKAMVPRQMAAAVDQFFVENHYRIFAAYADMVGAQKYIKAINPIDGEDPTLQFPLRRDWSNPLPVRLPDGTTVQRYEVIAAVGRSGLIATYPRPQEDNPTGGYDPDRVYRLDCGVSFRGQRVVDLPPDPAGREGRDQNGVHVYQLTDGRRFEITYHGGVPDGPFRAYFPDGRPWGEATYQHGRLVGPSWLILRDGRKINELTEGDAAEAAMAADLDAATQTVKGRAREKIKAGANEEVIADLNRVLLSNPADAEALQLRGEAHRKMGNLDQAIADYSAAEGFTDEQAKAYDRLPAHLLAAFFERWQQRSASGDASGAATDARVVVTAALREAGDHLKNRDPAAAERALAHALAVGPPAEVFAQHARARWMQDELADAEADYTRAIELAEAGKVQIGAERPQLISSYYYQRGHVRRWRGKPKEAADDFLAAEPMLGNGAERKGNAALWRFVATLEAGNRDQAAADLAVAERIGWWPCERGVADFLLGKITEAQLADSVARSNQNDDRVLAGLLTGLVHAQAGDTSGAKERYRKALPFSASDFMVEEAARRAYLPLAAKVQPGP